MKAIFLCNGFDKIFSVFNGEAVEKLPFKGDAGLENIIKNTVYRGLPDRIDLLGKPKNKTKDQLLGGNHDRSL